MFPRCFQGWGPPSQDQEQGLGPINKDKGKRCFFLWSHKISVFQKHPSPWHKTRALYLGKNGMTACFDQVGGSLVATEQEEARWPPAKVCHKGRQSDLEQVSQVFASLGESVFYKRAHLGQRARSLMNTASPHGRPWHSGESDPTTRQETAILRGEQQAGWGLVQRSSERGLQTPGRLPVGKPMNFKLCSWCY